MGTKWHREDVYIGIRFRAEVVGKPKGEEWWPGATKDPMTAPGFGRCHSDEQINAAARKVLEGKPVEWFLERIIEIEEIEEDETEDDQ